MSAEEPARKGIFPEQIARDSVERERCFCPARRMLIRGNRATDTAAAYVPRGLREDDAARPEERERRIREEEQDGIPTLPLLGEITCFQVL